MKSLAILAATLGLTSAYYAPSIISERELTERDLDERTGCPRMLQAAEFVNPAYITHVSAKHPNFAFGPQYNGVFTPNDLASIFSFDIPYNRMDANCTLEFIFPLAKQTTQGHYVFNGAGSFFWKGYNPGSCPNATTTWKNQPEKGPFPDFPPIKMTPGHAYTIDVGPCFVAAGTCAAGMTWTNDTNFEFTQDYGSCPIGIYTAFSYGLPTNTQKAEEAQNATSS